MVLNLSQTEIKMTNSIATAAQVRKNHKNQGYDVKISNDGHVEYRKDGGAWLEGRWVSEYRVVDGEIVLVLALVL